MPVIAPARNAMVRPLCRLLRAASAVRTLARTEMFMPMKPAAPDRIAPITKRDRRERPRKKTTMTATTTPTMAIVVYWRREVGARRLPGSRPATSIIRWLPADSASTWRLVTMP